MGGKLVCTGQDLKKMDGAGRSWTELLVVVVEGIMKQAFCSCEEVFTSEDGNQDLMDGLDVIAHEAARTPCGSTGRSRLIYFIQSIRLDTTHLDG